MGEASNASSGGRVWLFAAGYFLCYAPYSALTKGLTGGLFAPGELAPTGFELLPSTVIASALGMFGFLGLMGWWRFATHHRVGPLRVPGPSRFTRASGESTAGNLATTTLADTVEGVSIVFVMLLMRGGVLVIAPIVDAITGRATRWFSWAGLGLSLAALLVAFSEEGGYEITLVCAVDVTVYLASYFLRLQLMSRLAKTRDREKNLRFFVEEQMVAAPVLLVFLAAYAGLDDGPVANEVAAGFSSFWSRAILPHAILVGLLSQGTGIFGGLILLDPSENTFSVPVNRCSSILAGVVASLGVETFLGGAGPSAHQLGGAALIVGAILFLTVPPQLERARRRA